MHPSSPLAARIGWAPLAAATALALLLAGCGDQAAGLPAAAASAPAAGAKPALTVTTTVPRHESLPTRLAANGNLAAWQEASVGAEAGGLRLAEVLVDVGDRVAAGQVLARFATDTLRAEQAQARASLAEAQAQAAEAAANAERARSLQATGALSASQIQQYVTAEQTALARADAARALLAAQQVRLDQATVRAPDAGVISARQATVGAVVGNGTELFRLIRQGRLEWRAEVTSAELARLAPGTPARVTAASGALLEGKVRMVGPTVDAQTRNALVYVDVKAVPGGPAAGSARAGMFARGEFDLGAQSALTVPQSAVVLREGFHYVFRVNADQRVSQLKIEPGRLVGDRLQVLGGLAADTRIVAAGGGFLNDGDLVRVVQAPGAAASAPKR